MVGSWYEITGYLASALVFATFSMKTILPLRLVAISSNVAFIVYSFGVGLTPILILHAVLLPLNVIRAHQHVASFRRIRAAAENTAHISALLPFMTRKELPEGSYIFRAGDHARNLYYLSNGQVLLPEIGKYLEEGDLFGEVGLFSDQQVRTTSAKCSKPCVMFTIGKDKIVELYHADSAFGYYLTKLIANRMHDNLTRSIADRARERAREEAIMARETNLRELGSARVETR
ncbi:Crp/Fnr family transcriptional regulator [Seohaeicola zhoushanensis]|uniref:Cyclic nucleotide-binding domain-containing protein n=1 Tax=Seohaeicola zhoushanensis TaxID=1569283 RepID=A0A8J3M5K1_9RHOB|nr:cyclic nucleotide-binding domain-containing protein [Seohaeicola zhoushanensis]GHF39739.1 hypothetical protein GCM10017056_09060 [Seohaeicola zhoushanensis]